MKYVWTAAAMLLEPIVTVLYWVAYNLARVETYCAIQAGEPQDD